jgi:hypothetical protein
LGLSPQTLNKKKVVCSAHFRNEDIPYSNFRKRLKKHAVPQKFTDDDDGIETNSPKLKVLAPVKTYGNQPRRVPLYSPPISSPQPSTSKEILSPKTKVFIDAITEMPEKSPTKLKVRRRLFFDKQSMPPVREFKLIKTISRQKKVIKEQKNTICMLKEKAKSEARRLKTEKKKTCIEDVIFSSPYSEALVNMQVRHKAGKVWTKPEKDFSLLSFYKSPGAYKYWRNSLKIVLPGLSTIHDWVADIDCLPGFNQQILEEIQRKTSTMNESEKYCSVIFDEIKIKKCLEYNTKYDLIEGLHDHGENGRKNKFGSQIMLFLIRGLYSNWKLPYAYFVSETTIKNTDLHRVLQEGLKFLMNAGLKVISVVCDQGKNNQSALSRFGVNKTNFFFQIQNKTIFSIYDVLHLVKNFRNNFLKHRFVFKHNFVDFKDIIETYKIDQKSVSAKSLPKITEVHLNPDSFQKMNCSLATQIFSKSVAAAIRTAVGTGELLSDTALHTADFVEFVNDLFDALNSRELYCSNPQACAISSERPLIQQTLENALEPLEKMTKEMSPGKHTRPDCFDGMIQTIRAVLAIYNRNKSFGYTYLLTSRLNQDPIENKFAAFRQRGGFNMNPTVRTFRSTFRLSLKVNLLKPSRSSNCEEDKGTSITLMGTKTKQQSLYKNPVDYISLSPSVSSTYSETCSSSSGSRQTKLKQHNITLQDCANDYFAGYLVKKTLDKFSCKDCESQLVCEQFFSNKTQLLILNRTYKSAITGLKKPAPFLNKFVKKSLKIVYKTLEKCPQKRFLLQFLYKKIEKIAQKVKYLKKESCHIHIQYLIRLLIRCKIFKECKWRTLYCKKNIKQKRKLDILQSL